MGATVRAEPFASLPPATAYQLWALRSAVFVVEQDCVYLDLDGRDTEPGTLHLWVEESGEVLATLRVLQDGEVLRIGRVATAAGHRGRGWAGRLLVAALEPAGDRDVVLDAQSHLVPWYAGHGFAVSGEDFVEDGIPHTPMRRPGGDATG